MENSKSIPSMPTTMGCGLAHSWKRFAQIGGCPIWDKTRIFGWCVAFLLWTVGPENNQLFFKLKTPIPFDKVSSNPWLRDSSTNLEHYATRAFQAQSLVDVLTNRDRKHLHAVLTMPVLDYRTSLIQLTARDR
jgi:hypothetical protein